jgi:hypothetical protein
MVMLRFGVGSAAMFAEPTITEIEKVVCLIHGGQRPKARGRGQRSEVRGQRPEARGQRPEARGQRSEVRGQRSAIRDQRSVFDRGCAVSLGLTACLLEYFFRSPTFEIRS